MHDSLCLMVRYPDVTLPSWPLITIPAYRGRSAPFGWTLPRLRCPFHRWRRPGRRGVFHVIVNQASPSQDLLDDNDNNLFGVTQLSRPDLRCAERKMMHARLSELKLTRHTSSIVGWLMLQGAILSPFYQRSNCMVPCGTSSPPCYPGSSKTAVGNN